MKQVYVFVSDKNIRIFTYCLNMRERDGYEAVYIGKKDDTYEAILKAKPNTECKDIELHI